MGVFSIIDPTSDDFLGGAGISGGLNQGFALIGNLALELLGIEFPDPDYQDRKLSTRGPVNPRRVVYGQARVGGQIVYIESTGTNNELLNIIYVVASHPCDSIISVFLDDKLSTDEKFDGILTVITSIDGLGVIPQGILDATGIDNSRFKFQGLSYVFCQFKYDAEAYQGIPNVSVVINGKNDILDPRTNLSGFTANAALCELDWLRTQMGVVDNDIDFPTWRLAADDCDTLVAGKDADGNDILEPRFELNGTILLSGTKLGSLKQMIQNGGVLVRYNQGIWGAIIQKFEAPKPLKIDPTTNPLKVDSDIVRADSTLFTADEDFNFISTFDENDLISSINFIAGSSKQDKVNTVKGSFISADNEYEQIEYPVIDSPIGVSEDLEILEQTIDYQLVSSASQCRRLSKIRIEKSRFGIGFSAVFRLNSWDYVVGDTINFSYERFGFVDRVFRIISRDINGINGINLTLVEDDPSIYDWNEGDALNVEVPPLLNLPDADFVEAPTSLTATEELYIANTSNAVKARVNFTWVAGDTTARYFSVEGSFDGGEFRIFSDYVVGLTFSVDDLEPGSWTFRVRATNGIEAKSNYINLIQSVVGKTAPPQDVTGFTEIINPFIITISWDAVPDLDIREYEIRLGLVWETAETLQVINALRWDWETRPTGNEILLIKAIDTTGNESVNAAQATVTIQNPNSVSPLIVQVIDNNVLLTWANATTSFNIDTYEVRRGEVFSSAEVVGFTDGTFQTVFEVTGGVFKYWVRAIDVQGNTGLEVSVNANVDNPPDFILQSNQLLDLSTGTKVNILTEVGAAVTADGTIFTADSTAVTADSDDTFVLVGPANITETWQDHFDSIIAAGSFPVPVTADNAILKADSTLFTADSSNPSIRQLQTDNGFPFFLQPTPTMASYENTTDFGGLFTLSRIQLTPDIDILAGNPGITFTIGYSDDNITFTDVVGLEATGIDFQFVRIKIDITSSSQTDLLRINSLRLKLDVKLKTDAGGGTASASGGTQVDFNLQFVDISSIQVTASGTSSVIAVYDFIDLPNPTNFDVRLFDSSGTQVAGDFSWNVRGV